jgi:hypothetical protein
MVLSQIVMRAVPLLGCTFLANLGCKVSNTVRVICVYNAAAAPVLIPWLQPYFETGRVSALELSVMAVTTIGASVFAGSTASYAAIKARMFGIRVQGFTWGFMLSAATGAVYAAHLRENYPLVVPLMAWIIFATSLAQGYFIGVASLIWEFRVNQIFTSLAGAISGLMVVASLGYDFTTGLSIGAMASGNGGCSSPGCYAAVILTLLFAVVSAINQSTFRDPDHLLGLERKGCYKRVMAKAWMAIAVFCQPVFIMDRTLAIIGSNDADIDEEDRAEAIQRLLDSVAKLLQFIGQWLLLGGTATLVVSTLELFALGVYTRTKAMTYLGLLLLCTCGFLIATLYLGITSHQMSTANFKKKRRRQKLFVRFAFFCSPCVVLMAMICLTLSSFDYLQVPWISELVGLDKRKLLQDDGSLSDAVADSDGVGGEVSDSLVSTLRSKTCERANCSIPISAAMEEVLYEMPTAAYTLVMLSVGLIMVIILTCRSLGGGYFLASQVSGFATILNFVNGLMVAAFGFFMYEDTANAFEAPTNTDEALDSLRAIQAKGEEAMLIQILAIGALWMICVSLVGVVGHEKWFLPVAAMRKLVLRIYLILLLVTLFAFIFIFMSCFYFAANVDELTAKYWNDPLFQKEKNRCDPT